MAKTGRNELCPCGSGLKYKKCHGDPVKISACNMIAQLKMKELIMTERIKKGLVCKHGKKLGEYCKNCGEEGVIGKGIYNNESIEPTPPETEDINEADVSSSEA